MVENCITALAWTAMAQQPAQPVLERLDPARRVAVIMALLGLVLIGLALVAFVMLGANWVRRLARHRPGLGAQAAKQAVAENRRLRESLKSVLPEVKTNDTIHFGRSSKETQVDT